MKAEGFNDDDVSVEHYRIFVRNMSVEDRKEIFFLRINDEMFKPEIDPTVEGHSIVTDLHDFDDFKSGEKVKFTDFKLDDCQQGYFIIAASAT